MKLTTIYETDSHVKFNFLHSIAVLGILILKIYEVIERIELFYALLGVLSIFTCLAHLTRYIMAIRAKNTLTKLMYVMYIISFLCTLCAVFLVDNALFSGIILGISFTLNISVPIIENICKKRNSETIPNAKQDEYYSYTI